MNRFVLDTDHLSLLFRGNVIVANNVYRRPGSSIAISIVSVEETLSGWYTLLRRVRDPNDLPSAYENLSASVAFLCPLVRLPFDERAADVYQELLRRKTKVGKMDLRIAATAIAEQDTLVTRNIRDFGRIPELRLTDWSRT